MANNDQPQDARFEDADDAPMALRALEAGDVPVISALLQDAVFPITEMRWDNARRRFALLINRFRWEVQGTTPERVQAVLAVEDVLKVSTQGIDRADTDTVLSALALEWAPSQDGMGRLTALLAGDGAIALDVEALEITLRDVTQTYGAVSGKVPDHGTWLPAR
jgi:rRNA maturation endonuclease Nob1